VKRVHNLFLLVEIPHILKLTFGFAVLPPLIMIDPLFKEVLILQLLYAALNLGLFLISLIFCQRSLFGFSALSIPLAPEDHLLPSSVDCLNPGLKISYFLVVDRDTH
jgi:hypothetical protein